MFAVMALSQFFSFLHSYFRTALDMVAAIQLTLARLVYQ
jgi:hypothetical protein